MQEEPLAGKGHHSLSCVGGTPAAARPRSPLVAARIKREKWLYADFHLKCLKCLSPPLSPFLILCCCRRAKSHKAPSVFRRLGAFLARQRKSERAAFCAWENFEWRFQRPRNPPPPSHRDQSYTHTARVCFMPCRALPCVFPRLELTREYGLLHPTRSFSSLEIAWMRRADGDVSARVTQNERGEEGKVLLC